MPVRQRGNMWQADIRVGANSNPTGKEVRLRLAAPTKEAALSLEARARVAICQTGTFAEASKQKETTGTLKDALQAAWSNKAGAKGGWSMQKSGEVAYAHAEECCQIVGMDRLCKTITRADLDKLVTHYRDIGNSNSTIRVKVARFYKLLDFAVREGWMTARPKFDRPAPGIPRSFIFSNDLEKAFLTMWDIEDKEFADFCRVAIETGLRLNELANARCWQWNFETGLVQVTAEQAKSGVMRNVVLSDAASAIMKKRCEGKKPGDKLWRSNLNIDSISLRMRRSRELLGYSDNPHFVFHSFRHTRATRLAAKSQNPFVVQDQLGHADIKTSMRYIHMAKVAMNADSWRNA